MADTITEEYANLYARLEELYQFRPDQLVPTGANPPAPKEFQALTGKQQLKYLRECVQTLESIKHDVEVAFGQCQTVAHVMEETVHYTTAALKNEESTLDELESVRGSLVEMQNRIDARIRAASNVEERYRLAAQIRLHDETRAENGNVVLADYLPPESELAELAAACARAANENSTNIKKFTTTLAAMNEGYADHHAAEYPDHEEQLRTSRRIIEEDVHYVTDASAEFAAANAAFLKLGFGENDAEKRAEQADDMEMYIYRADQMRSQLLAHYHQLCELHATFMHGPGGWVERKAIVDVMRSRAADIQSLRESVSQQGEALMQQSWPLELLVELPDAYLSSLAEAKRRFEVIALLNARTSEFVDETLMQVCAREDERRAAFYELKGRYLPRGVNTVIDETSAPIHCDIGVVPLDDLVVGDISAYGEFYDRIQQQDSPFRTEQALTPDSSGPVPTDWMLRDGVEYVNSIKAEANKKLKSAKAENKALGETIETLNEDMYQLREDSNTTIAELEEELQSVTADLNAEVDTSAKLSAALEALRAEIDVVKGCNSELEASLNSTKDAYAELEEKYNNTAAAVTAASIQVANLSTEHGETSEAVEKLGAELSAANERNKKMMKANKKLTKEKEELKSSLRDSEQTATALSGSLLAIAACFPDTRIPDDGAGRPDGVTLRTIVSDTVDRADLLQKSVDSLTVRAESLEADNMRLAADIGAAVADRDSFAAKLDEVVETYNNTVTDLEADLDSVEESYEKIVADAEQLSAVNEALKERVEKISSAADNNYKNWAERESEIAQLRLERITVSHPEIGDTVLAVYDQKYGYIMYTVDVETLYVIDVATSEEIVGKGEQQPFFTFVVNYIAPVDAEDYPDDCFTISSFEYDA